MSEPAPELADVFRLYGPAYRQAHRLPLHQSKLMWAIEACRTPALGGVVQRCQRCRLDHIQYRSCRNRHCPKCQGAARQKWLQQRRAELLPVVYFHVVFTLPMQLAAIAFYNKKPVYDLLFRITAETLLTIAADPKRLGVQLGFFAVLHSWGQNLHFHPHLHCVVPSGGLRPDRRYWIHGRRRYLLPVKMLSRLFRRRFLEELEKLYAAGRLQLVGALEPLRKAGAFHSYLAPLRQAEWVVYAKPPFGGAPQVLEYLGRYTHRVAISNRRLRKLEQGQVSFEWKDYRARPGEQSKLMTLSADEFIRRFLQHSLPTGFQRIRYYGFLANCHRRDNLDCCRRLLNSPSSTLLPVFPTPQPSPQPPTCPQCGRPLIRFVFPPSCRIDTS